MSKVDKFVQHVVGDLIKHKVNVNLLCDRPFLDDGDGIPCVGYFEATTPALYACITGKQSEWLGLLAHEYSHFRQFITKDKSWTSCELPDGRDATTVFFNWLTGSRTSKRLVQKCVEITLKCEMDCERRVIKLIKRFDLPINLRAYVKKSNAYLYTYPFAMKHRRWNIGGKPPYRCANILRVVPTKMLSFDEIMDMPEDYEKLAKRYCFKKGTKWTK